MYLSRSLAYRSLAPLYTHIHTQEADYFLRSRLHYPDGACIHDATHGRIFTPLFNWEAVSKQVLDARAISGWETNYTGRAAMQAAMRPMAWLFKRKWRRLQLARPGLNAVPDTWNTSYSAAPLVPCVSPDSPQEPLYTPFEYGITNAQCVFGVAYPIEVGIDVALAISLGYDPNLFSNATSEAKWARESNHAEHSAEKQEHSASRKHHDHG